VREKLAGSVRHGVIGEVKDFPFLTWTVWDSTLCVKIGPS